jgi:hypothetical protein
MLRRSLMQHMLVVASRGLARWTWLATVATIATCAAFTARAACSLVEAAVRSPEPGPAVRVRTRPQLPTRAGDAVAVARGERRRTAGDQLVVRNMFCSTCVPGVVAGDTGLTELAMSPLAVLIETGLGSERRATIRVVASEVQGSWGLGEVIPGLGEVDRIEPTWIELIDPAGHRGRLSLRPSHLDPAAGRGSDTAMSESPPAASRWAARIHKLDDQNYDVDRGLVRELVSGATRADGVRPEPILDHGEIKGLRLPRISTTSIAFALGLHSGDTLTAIDGAPITNLQQLLDLYARLDQVTAVELSGSHAGKPLVRTLRLR